MLHELDRDLPEGAEFVVLTDTNKFLYASIRSVIRTLLEAILLVIVVVYVFLQDIKSTLIPAISIFVSIIGTFAVMSMIGFSINLLTLFALVLAIGTVVDDAIVVVEAVQAKFDEGYQSAVLAADDAMKDVSSAILTSTIIFMAVFFPVAMMGGTSGAFYAQFGITMAVAVGISAINAFTLSPALCALLLKPYIDEHGNTKDNFAARFRKAFNAVFYRLSRRYVRGVMFILHRRWLMWSSIAVSFVLLGAAGQRHQDGPYPRRRHRNGHGEHEYEARHVNGADRQGDGAHQQPPRQYRRDRIQRCGCRLLFQRFRSVAGHVFRDTQRLGTA